MTDFTHYTPRFQKTCEQKEAIDGIRRQIARTASVMGLAQADLQQLVGNELEWIAVAGEEAYYARLEILRQGGEGQTVKGDTYMPEGARIETVQKKFTPSLKGVTRTVSVVPEPTRTQFATIRILVPEPESDVTEHWAMHQRELVWDPLPPVIAPRVLFSISQILIENPEEHELVRVDLSSKFGDAVYSSSIHQHHSMTAYMLALLKSDLFSPEEKLTLLHNPVHDVPQDILAALGSDPGSFEENLQQLSIQHIAELDGLEVNLLSRSAFDANAEATEISEFGLCLGYMHNLFLGECMFIAAPAEQSYERFNDQKGVAAPHFIGTFPRKSLANMGSALFRGDGRISYGEYDTEGKPDSGPLRFELRVMCPEAIGHPNKDAYPHQRAFPFEMQEGIEGMKAEAAEMFAYRVLMRRMAGGEALEAEQLTFLAQKQEFMTQYIDGPMPLHLQVAVTHAASAEMVMARHGALMEALASSIPAEYNDMREDILTLLDYDTPLSEVRLMERQYRYPRNKAGAVERFRGSPLAAKIYGADRIEGMIERAAIMDDILYLDKCVHAGEQGAHVDRTEALEDYRWRIEHGHVYTGRC